ncbi:MULTISPECIES: hypothetical protein [Sorangium]|uniref:Uncharacterized protein n=1 Tax=Sorangium cellulosum TaxID=56 RepID=A0A4P2QHB2_SORCE|nr:MULTISPECIES: hypothetical protein [Sorangium]AUX29289.1 uncharacterized protein SOCE836_013770 [Sorangium cellulosum]WCQ88679.1 hypothetical protein NQZ70_01359 [Sorangium sp. Soce836]
MACCIRARSSAPMSGMTMASSLIGITAVDSCASMVICARIVSSLLWRSASSARLRSVMSRSDTKQRSHVCSQPALIASRSVTVLRSPSSVEMNVSSSKDVAPFPRATSSRRKVITAGSTKMTDSPARIWPLLEARQSSSVALFASRIFTRAMPVKRSSAWAWKCASRSVTPDAMIRSRCRLTADQSSSQREIGELSKIPR